MTVIYMAKKPKTQRGGQRRRLDMAEVTSSEGIPDTFENVIKALVQPVKPPDKGTEEGEKD